MSPVFTEPQSSPFYRTALLSGETGTEQTIEVMRQLVDAAQADPTFVRMAKDIVRRVTPYDTAGEAKAIFDWVKSHIRFTKDPLTKETLFPPQELLKNGSGDCDDISMLMASLDMAVGLPARLVTVAGNPDQPNDFSHVYVEVDLDGDGNWIAQDAARRGTTFGEEPPYWFRKKVWSLADPYSQEMRGMLSGYTQVPPPNWPGRRYGLGALGDDSDTTGLISQGLQELPSLIAVGEGGATSTTTAAGTTATGPTNPYSSFATMYTPGYGIPGAGYPLLTSPTSSVLPWILVGLGAFALMAWSHK